ncbi:MAG: DUF4360 domain-containing protein [Pseudobdellovibrio sp.]
MIKSILTIGAVLLATSQVLAQTVTVRGVRLSGSGCDSATASAIVTPDGQTVSVLFDNYSAQIGVGSTNPGLTTIQKDCHVLIDVDVPFGQQYAIIETDYNGFAALPASAYGFHRFTQIIPNQMPPSMREAQLKGPVASNYSVVVQQKPGRSPYSTCNKPQQTIDLLSQLSVSYLPGSTDRSMAMINLDSVDTGMQSRFKLTWRTCR